MKFFNYLEDNTVVFPKNKNDVKIKLEKQKPDFLLDDSKPLVINGKTWHWMSHFKGGWYHLYVFVFLGNKSYTIRFISKSNEHTKHLPIS